MSSENNQSNILSSWKEIATYLKCGVRTCIRYEGKYGLPVYRLEEKPKTHVFAYKNELDEWLKKGASLRENYKSDIKLKPKWNKAYYLIFAAIVIGVSILLLNSFLLKNHSPSNFHIEGSKLIIVDNNNNNLWEYDTGIKNLVDESNYRDHFQTKKPNSESRYDLPHIIIKDIDGDNKNDVIFSIQTQSELNEGELHCFNHEGVPLWRFTAGKEMKYGSKTFSSDYRIEGFDLCDFDHDGNFEILVIAYHHYRFPVQVVLLNNTGELLGEYWNSGYLSDYEFIDIDNDGTKEIILVGVNNEYGRGSLIVLESESIKGGSPQKEKEFKCKELEIGSELYYVLFPRTDLDFLDRQINTIKKIRILKNQRLYVDVSYTNIVYELNFNLKPLYVTLSHSFKHMYSLARAEGRIKGELNKEYEQNLLNGLLYWDGQNWISTPTMTSHWKNKALNH
jgi:hypothetical protein